MVEAKQPRVATVVAATLLAAAALSVSPWGDAAEAGVEAIASASLSAAAQVMPALPSKAMCPAKPAPTYTAMAQRSLCAAPRAYAQAIDMREDGYNSEYIFGLSRGVANSTMTPAVKPLLFILTIPLDLVLLPFAAIGGFF